MEKEILKKIKKTFNSIIPKDSRSKITPMELVTNLIFCFLGDSKTFSLEAIRRFMIKQTGVAIGRSSFWERLARNRSKTILKSIIEKLMQQLTQSILGTKDILADLGVSQILLLDSTSISLWDGAKDNYPGTRTTAGIKWHACFDLLTGVMTWFSLSPTSTHDRKCIPSLESISGKLIIFDLGYWDYGLLFQIQKAKGFFLSRIKQGSQVLIDTVICGISNVHVGKNLSSLNLKKKKSDIIELIGYLGSKEINETYRIIGFWNPDKKLYHWYITNLTVSAVVVYSLYRLRWQIELIFKACKNSLNANSIPSNKDNIIESLLLASIAACLISNSVLSSISCSMDNQKKLAFSFQRIAKVAIVLATDFILFITRSSKKFLDALLKNIKLLANELYDPNYKHRKTSLQKIYYELK